MAKKKPPKKPRPRPMPRPTYHTFMTMTTVPSVPA